MRLCLCAMENDIWLLVNIFIYFFLLFKIFSCFVCCCWGLKLISSLICQLAHWSNEIVSNYRSSRTLSILDSVMEEISLFKCDCARFLKLIFVAQIRSLVFFQCCHRGYDWSFLKIVWNIVNTTYVEIGNMISSAMPPPLSSCFSF